MAHKSNKWIDQNCPSFSQIIQNRADYLSAEQSLGITSLSQPSFHSIKHSKASKKSKQYKKYRKMMKKKKKKCQKMKKKQYDPQKIKLLNAIKASLSSTEYQIFYSSLKTLFEQKNKMTMNEFDEFVLDPFIKLFDAWNRFHFLKDLSRIIPKKLSARYEQRTNCLQQQKYESNQFKKMNAMSLNDSEQISKRLNDLCIVGLSDRSLTELSQYCPITSEQLKIFGIDARIIREHGMNIIDVIKCYLHCNGLVSPFLQSIDYFQGIEDEEFNQIIDEQFEFDETGFIQNNHLLIKCLNETEEKIKKKKEIQKQIEEKIVDLQQCIEKEIKIKQQKQKIMQNVERLKLQMSEL